MNKILLILVIVFGLTSCESKSNKDYIILKGKVLNPTTEQFKLRNRDGEGLFSANISKDGTFVVDTITTGFGTYRFEGTGINRVNMYLTNGGEYNLTFDEKNMVDTAELTGPMLNPSNYLMTKGKRIDSLRGMSFTAYKTLEPSAFKAKGIMVRDNLLTYLDSFPDMPKEFVQFERQELINYYLLYLVRYEYLHGQVTGTLDTFRVSDEFLKDLEDVDYLNEAEFKQRGYYKSLVKEYFELKAKKSSEETGDNYHITELKTFGAIPNEYIKNNLLALAAKSDLSEIHNLDDYYNTFLSVSNSEENNENVTERYKELKKLAKGSPSPIFTDYINHAGGTSSLTDFRGKYLYIDIWATWCSPCLKEVPFLKEVEKKYHGKNIEFVSISVDIKKMEGAWRKMVTDKELSGVQLLAEGAWSSSIIKGYQIKGIPRFILIDPEGNIVSAKAPRPSQSELITLFQELGI
ncbi:TlpA disulfide reductase family protein [Polaribacter sp. 20A6]|uniref:TlpA family protein disulfide reductase n=1 Tax=Polaribacter sp. 20A6 TaxID=2687289 RepID=UPI0013FDB2A7|nr:TlpA disulfide reductase family protein [Polaribacter sp. 20A6]